MAIKLEIYATDPEVISLVQRYWAMNDEGDFREKVGALLPFREVKNSAGIAGFVKTQCRAIDDNQSCSICGCALAITSRSQISKDPQQSARPCASCKAAQDEERRVAETQAKAKLQVLLAKRIELVGALTTRYEEIPDDLALILLALNRTIAGGLAGRTFAYRDCQNLAPRGPEGAEDFIIQLWKAKVLSDAPHASGAAAYSVSGESLSFYTGRATYFLVPDESLGASAEAFQSKIVNCLFHDKQSLLRLWFDYAVADCMAYLYDQCHDRKVDIPQNEVAKIKIAIRTAVQFFSVAQVWSLLWKVVREVAGLNHHRFYKDAKAGEPISERLVHHYEQARKPNKELKSWSRVEFLPPGTLGHVFKERFGIDESTSGAAVTVMFSESRPMGREEIVASIGAQVKDLMACALANGSCAVAMYDFAELIRDGYEILEALDKITKIYAVSRTV